MLETLAYARYNRFSGVSMVVPLDMISRSTLIISRTYKVKSREISFKSFGLYAVYCNKKILLNVNSVDSKFPV